jgi:hypothetical protein
MERAGRAAADMAAELCAGKGRPGARRARGITAATRASRRRAWRKASSRVKVVSHPRELPPDRSWGMVIDGLFGIGLAREITGDYAELVQYANRQSCPVLALDVPSGIQSDTGQVLGCAVRATHTITFHRAEAGPPYPRRSRPLRRDPGRIGSISTSRRPSPMRG